MASHDDIQKLYDDARSAWVGVDENTGRLTPKGVDVDSFTVVTKDDGRFDYAQRYSTQGAASGTLSLKELRSELGLDG